MVLAFALHPRLPYYICHAALAGGQSRVSIGPTDELGCEFPGWTVEGTPRSVKVDRSPPTRGFGDSRQVNNSNQTPTAVSDGSGQIH
jgi:hypothetical protein